MAAAIEVTAPTAGASLTDSEPIEVTWVATGTAADEPRVTLTLHDAAHIKEAQRILTRLRFSFESTTDESDDSDDDSLTSEDGSLCDAAYEAYVSRVASDPALPRWRRSLVPWWGLWC